LACFAGYLKKGPRKTRSILFLRMARGAPRGLFSGLSDAIRAKTKLALAPAGGNKIRPSR
jgi:hypothetical protein